jgi:hypothetical protein
VKESQPFVDDIDQAHATAGDALLPYITAVFEATKVVSVQTEIDSAALLETYLEKGFADAAFADQYRESKGNKDKQRLLTAVIAYKAIMIPLLKNPASLKWGSILRSRLFNEIGTKTMQHWMSEAIPVLTKLVLQRGVWNQLSLGESLEFMDRIWKPTYAFLTWAISNKYMVKAEKGSPLGNGKKASTEYLKLTDVALKMLQSLDGPDQDIKKEGGGTKYPYVQLEAWCKDKSPKSKWAKFLLAASFTPDLRVMMQSTTVRQDRKNIEVIEQTKEVITRCKKLVMFVSPKTPISEDVSMNTGSEFCNIYYRMHRILKATVRNAKNSVFGGKGGANTRDGIGYKVSNPAAPEINMGF